MRSIRPSVIGFLAFLATAAHAGDAAKVKVLGFTPDGGVFAFEEHGVQDGSGFAYANRFYVDTASDSFVAGTPIRVRLDDEGATLDEARAKAQADGEKIAADATLEENRGVTAGWNPVTELSADPHRIAVNPRPVIPPIDEPLEFRLEELVLSQPDRCRELGEIVGFRLSRIGLAPGETARLVHEDDDIPQSRGCPLGYHIGGVQTFFPEGGEPVFAVLIAVRSFGFEGPDHRWMAVTGKL
jgi:predicted secreted protein